MKLEAIRQKIWRPRNDIDAPTRGVLCNWVREDDGTSVSPAPMIDMHRYGELLSVLPDHIVENLEKSRLAQDGRMPMIKAGLGYEELLSSIIVDAAAIASSAAETKLVPALKLPSNFMAISGNLPGKTLRVSLRGRGTTLTTGATMTIRNRIAATDIITGTILMASGAMVADATVQTATMWSVDGEVVCRSVGSAGTVFAMGEASLAWHSAFTAANAALRYLGSAGSATPSTAVFDTTIDEFFQITAQWSLSTAYSIQAHLYLLEATN
jgi:hypothetical protein